MPKDATTSPARAVSTPNRDRLGPVGNNRVVGRGARRLAFFPGPVFNNLPYAGRDLPVNLPQILCPGVLRGDDGKIRQPPADLAHQPPLAPVSQTRAAEYGDQSAAVLGDKRTQRLQSPFQAGRRVGEVHHCQKRLPAVHALHTPQNRRQGGDTFLHMLRRWIPSPSAAAAAHSMFDTLNSPISRVSIGTVAARPHQLKAAWASGRYSICRAYTSAVRVGYTIYIRCNAGCPVALSLFGQDLPQRLVAAVIQIEYRHAGHARLALGTKQASE